MAEIETLSIVIEVISAGAVASGIAYGKHDFNVEKAKIEELVEKAEDLLVEATDSELCKKKAQKLANEINRAITRLQTKRLPLGAVF